MNAIRATYSDLKLVKTRKVLQLIFEVPIEEADNALRVLGGMPRADAKTWVGIALITEEAATQPADKPRRRMADLSRAQQAGILCNHWQFQHFVNHVYEVNFSGSDDTEKTAEFVRNYCKVASRAELDNSEHGHERWDQLRTEYDAWTGKIGWPEPARAGG